MTDCIICHQTIVGRGPLAKTCLGFCQHQHRANIATARYHAIRTAFVYADKPCAFCGTSFTPEHAAEKYCTRVCCYEKQKANARGSLKTKRRDLKQAFARAGI